MPTLQTPRYSSYDTALAAYNRQRDVIATINWGRDKLLEQRYGPAISDFAIYEVKAHVGTCNVDAGRERARACHEIAVIAHCFADAFLDIQTMNWKDAFCKCAQAGGIIMPADMPQDKLAEVEHSRKIATEAQAWCDGIGEIMSVNLPQVLQTAEDPFATLIALSETVVCRAVEQIDAHLMLLAAYKNDVNVRPSILRQTTVLGNHITQAIAWRDTYHASQDTPTLPPAFQWKPS
ncbi:MAG: hypothetical protein V4621_01605 [Pseudomonadota bacterium]